MRNIREDSMGSISGFESVYLCVVMYNNFSTASSSLLAFRLSCCRLSHTHSLSFLSAPPKRWPTSSKWLGIQVAFEGERRGGKDITASGCAMPNNWLVRSLGSLIKWQNHYKVSTLLQHLSSCKPYNIGWDETSKSDSCVNFMLQCTRQTKFHKYSNINAALIILDSSVWNE